MANTKISQLTAIDAVSASDIIPIGDASGTPAYDTKKATVTQVIAAIPDVTTSVHGLMLAADKVKLDAATSTSLNSTIVTRDASGNTAVNVLTAAQVTVTNAPSATTDATNKAYVDSIASGLVVHASCIAATTGNINLTGGAPNTLDGVALTVGDRLLVKNQSVNTQNGIYTISSLGSGSNGTWFRATDADTGAKLDEGSYVFVNSGTTQSSTGWVMNSPAPITIGTTPIIWVLFSQIGAIPGANITGTIPPGAIPNGGVDIAKFAASIRPVELVATMPTSGNFLGRIVFLTATDGAFAANKLYRWTSSVSTTGTSGWSSAVPAVDITGNLTDSQIADLAASKLTGQITQTQITDGSISTPKLAAGSVVTAKIAAGAVTANEISSGAVTTGKLAAGSVTANELAANSVIAGKVSAGAISTTELAVGSVSNTRIADGAISTVKLAADAVTASKILAGSITADRLSVTTLSAITVNLGTVTAGSITTNATIDVGSSTARVQISNTGLNISSGRITLAGDGSNPYVRVTGAASFASHFVELNGQSGAIQPFLQAAGGGRAVLVSSGGVGLIGGANVIVGSGCSLVGPGTLNVFGGSGGALSIACGEDSSGGTFQGWLVLQVNGRPVKVQFEV